MWDRTDQLEDAKAALHCLGVFMLVSLAMNDPELEDNLVLVPPSLRTEIVEIGRELVKEMFESFNIGPVSTKPEDLMAEYMAVVAKLEAAGLT